jgi:hypothetical protein
MSSVLFEKEQVGAQQVHSKSIAANSGPSSNNTESKNATRSEPRVWLFSAAAFETITININLQQTTNKDNNQQQKQEHTQQSSGLGVFTICSLLAFFVFALACLG